MRNRELHSRFRYRNVEEKYYHENRRRLKDTIKLDLNYMSWKFMDWINVPLIVIFSQTLFK